MSISDIEIVKKQDRPILKVEAITNIGDNKNCYKLYAIYFPDTAADKIITKNSSSESYYEKEQIEKRPISTVSNDCIARLADMAALPMFSWLTPTFGLIGSFFPGNNLVKYVNKYITTFYQCNAN